MFVSLPGCPCDKVADIVRRTAKSGYNVAAATIVTVQTAGFHRQAGEVISADRRTTAVADSIPSYSSHSQHSLPYRAGAHFSRRDCRQQAGRVASLSDVLFILNKEHFSSITTNH